MTTMDDPIAVRRGTLPLLLTAPHAIHLCRDGAPPHKPEDLTGFIVDVLAESLGASSVTWSAELVSRSARRAAGAAPDPCNRDPNFLHASELASNPWNGAVRQLASRWLPWGSLHADVHGRRDHVPGVNDDSVDASDCDCGLGAMRLNAPPPVVELAERLLSYQLGEALAGSPFRLNMRPRLTGAWADAERSTVSQQSVGCATAAVQLELSLRFRNALHADDALRARFGGALATVSCAMARAAAESIAPGLSAEPPHLIALFVTSHPLELLGLRVSAGVPATLPEHTRVFRANGHAANWGGGACDFAPRAGERVHGAVFWVTQQRVHAIDRALSEGAATQRVRMRVRLNRRVDWQLRTAHRNVGSPHAELPTPGPASRDAEAVEARGAEGDVLSVEATHATEAAHADGGEGTGADVWLDAIAYVPTDADCAAANERRTDRLRSPRRTHRASEPPAECGPISTDERPAASYLCGLRRARTQCADPDAAQPLTIRSASDGGVIGKWRHPADEGDHYENVGGAIGVVGSGERITEGCGGHRGGGGSGDAGGSGFAALPLDALLLEVGMRLEPTWGSASTIASVSAKLRACGISTTTALVAALSETGAESGALNRRLRGARQSAFRGSTIEVMRQLLQIASPREG